VPPFLKTTNRHVAQVLQLLPALALRGWAQIMAPLLDFHLVNQPKEEQYLRAPDSSLVIGGGGGFGFGFGFAFGWQ
jgi:hypothetical protein